MALAGRLIGRLAAAPRPVAGARLAARLALSRHNLLPPAPLLSRRRLLCYAAKAPKEAAEAGEPAAPKPAKKKKEPVVLEARLPDGAPAEPSACRTAPAASQRPLTRPARAQRCCSTATARWRTRSATGTWCASMQPSSKRGWRASGSRTRTRSTCRSAAARSA